MLKMSVPIASFRVSLETCMNLYRVVSPYLPEGDDSINWQPIHSSQAKLIVSFAFLKLVASWEDYLEETFLRYLCGARTEDGYGPTLKISGCRSLENAYRLVSGRPDFRPGRDYLGWTDWKLVLARSRLFFERGEPFTRVLDGDVENIRQLNVVRNRVAHSSEKCRTEFRNLVKKGNNWEKVPKGYDVGRYLVSFPPGNLGHKETGYDRFSIYVESMFRIGNTLTPEF